ncbi:MAG TPA: hypothetical protein ENJ42_01865 [Hellea balneolensis]|uniref:Uncharacterized protein n=1 Tax=Hellea balneolensis TaxID=287478 RepID=A0A7C5QV98_9PROT|nr:hypothetical protein [Hellea balneolensis]
MTYIKPKHAAILLAGTSLLIATPLFANRNIGLRGAYSAPQSYGVQYAGDNYYVTPQAVPQYQYPAQQYQGQVIEQHVYQAPVGQTVSYTYANGGIPVGNYQASGLGLRGVSTAFHRGFNVGGMNVRTNAKHTKRMLDWQENTTGKTLTLLANRANGTLAPNSLTIGAGLKGGLMWQTTSDAGKFPILSRFPDFTAPTETSSGVFAINNAALAFTGTFGDWTTIYLQPEYSETEFFGQSEFQLRKAFVVLGNLEKTPFYMAFGRKTIDFGNFDGYNAFTQTEAQHFFWAVSDQPVLELGYYNNGLKITGTAFSGGRQLRLGYAGAENENKIANYAASIEKEFLLGRGAAFTVGASYIHDTSYRNNFTAHTFQLINSLTPPTNFIEYRNGAVDAFAEYNSPFFDAMVEYSSTLKPWGAAIPQDADGNVAPGYLIDPLGSPNDIDNIAFDQNLEVFVAQARIKPMLPNGRRMAIAAVGSWGNIGDDFVGVGIDGNPTSWKKNQQHALSIEYPVSDYLDLGVEYVYNKGFIPFVGPQLVSSNDTEAHAINIGLKARF